MEKGLKLFRRVTASREVCDKVFIGAIWQQEPDNLPDYIIKVSSKIKPSVEGDTVEDWLLSFANQKIRMPNKFFPGKEFLEYHNDVIFKA